MKNALLSLLKGKALFIIFLFSLFLNIYGIDWGLPFRWNVDQAVTPSLRLAVDKTIFPIDNIRPAFYYYLNLLVLAPYFIFLKCSSFPIGKLITVSKLSWNSLSLSLPQVAANIFIISRLLSALCGSLTVLVLYKIGKILFSKRIGLLSALILSMTMGFLVFNHLARSVALVDLLSMISMLYCFKYIIRQQRKKYFYYACMLSGLCFATKYNGLFLLLPVIMAYYLMRKDKLVNKNIGAKLLVLADKQVFCGIALFILVFIIASPSFVLKGLDYIRGLQVYGKGGYVPVSLKETVIFFPYNFIRLGLCLIDVFGIPFGICAILGFCYSVKHFFHRKEIKVIVLFILFIFSAFSLLPRVKISADSKFIMQIVPLFALLAAVFLDRVLLKPSRFKKKAYRVFSRIVVLFIFGWSFFYCLSLGLIFKKNDIRYESTKWIEDNLIPGSKIITTEEVEWSAGIGILKKFDVFVLGRISEEGSLMNYKFIKGVYGKLTAGETKLLNEQIAEGLQERGVFLLMPYCDFEPRQKIDSLVSKGLKVVKVFKRESSWYFNPNLAGYEPDKIFLMSAE